MLVLNKTVLMVNSVAGSRSYPLASHDVPIGTSQVTLAALNERSREIFRSIVESYLTTGEPVGSRNLARILPMPLSPASVRNVMSDLEHLGLVFAPHTSAGRLPTELGLRFFVDALMQVGDVSEQDRRNIEAQVAGIGSGKTVEDVLTEASQALSGLTRSAGIVLTAKANVRLKHIEFVRLEPERALVVMVAEDGQVENRVLPVPAGLPTSSLVEAGNFLNARLRGKTVAVLGLTFKPDTDDMREAPSIPLVTGLLDMGARVRAHDPVGMEQARKELPDIEYCDDPYVCVKGADAMVVVTEWVQYRTLDLERLKRELAQPVVVDLRNVYRAGDMAAHGFVYESVGRPPLTRS